MLDVNTYVRTWYSIDNGVFRRLWHSGKKSVTVLPWNDSVNGGCIRAGGWIARKERERESGREGRAREKKIASDEWKMSVQALVQINGGTRDFVGKTRRSGILAAPIWMFIYQPRFEFEFSRFQSFLREIVRGDLLSTIISEFSWIWKFLFNFSYTFCFVRFVADDFQCKTCFLLKV